jgi:hypothetical protein
MIFTIHKTATNEEVGRTIPYIRDGGCIHLPDRWVSDTLLIEGSCIIDVSTGVVKNCPGEPVWASFSGYYLVLGYYGHYKWGGNESKKCLMLLDKPVLVDVLPLEEIPALKPQNWTLFSDFCEP